MLDVRVTDVLGKGALRVNDERAAFVQDLPFPPIVEQKTEIFRQHLTDDGTSSGSEDMQIAAVDAPTEFWVEADGDAGRPADTWITTISFAIADAVSSLEKFGGISALTNGCELYYEKANGEKITIHGTLKSNWDFVRLCLGEPAFGDSTNAFLASKVAGNSQGFMPVLDFRRIMPLYGVLLAAGSGTKLVLNVRDQTDGVDAFDAIAYGFKRYE